MVENKVQNGFFQNQETLETPYPENVFERPNKETPKETKRGEENKEYPPEIAEDTEEREGMTPKNRTNPKQPQVLGTRTSRGFMSPPRRHRVGV